LVVELVIHPGVEQLAAEWQVPDVTEAGKDRIGKADRLRAHLVGVFEVRKEEEAIFFDRAAQVNAQIPPREERVFLPFERADGLRRIGAKRVVQGGSARTSKRRKCGNVVIAIEIESAAMKFIAAGAGDDIDRSNSGVPGRKIEVEGRDLELLHSLLREVL